MEVCRRQLQCGHVCAGYTGEPLCPSCLTPGCRCGKKGYQTGHDHCVICFDHLAVSPFIELQCGHIFHLHCVRTILQTRWHGHRITFSFTLCPICKAPIEHPALKDLIGPIQQLYDDVKRKSLTRLRYEGLDKCPEITSPTSPYYNRSIEFALHRYCYYPCFKCQTPYFGGTSRCEGEADDKTIKPEEMICPTCSSPQTKSQNCSLHGTDYIEFKCRYCCSIAVFFCFGTTHFCNSCHTNYATMAAMGDRLPHCPAGPSGKQLTGACPLGIQHPSNGTEYCLGCGLCANLHSF